MNSQEIMVPAAAIGKRLDIFLADELPQFSRAHLQRAIEAAGIYVNGEPSKPSYKLHEGDRIAVLRLEVPREGPHPQPIPLDILFEDDAIAVINKPAGMIVHPARGHWDGTMASALAHHFTQLSERGGSVRPGIVHRLDRDTSGAIVVAKNDQAHDALAEQFKQRSVNKQYLAIVVGVPDRDRDIINQPIGDHPTQREKKAIRADHPSSREATTFYEVEERFPGFALVRAQPKSGRTHQIRLHLAHIQCPVLCDRLYGGRARITHDELAARVKQHASDADAEQKADSDFVLARQALHSHRLSIAHPRTNQTMDFEAPLPDDMMAVLSILRAAGR